MALGDNINAFMEHIRFLSLGLKNNLSSQRSLDNLVVSKKSYRTCQMLGFPNVFLEESANIRQEQTWADKHAIELEQGKQLLYRSIHSLELVEPKTIKTYIKSNLANNFIKALELLASALILFICKIASSPRLYINYWGPNNLIINNWYPLLLIGKSLDWLDQAKWFIQLDLICTYHLKRIKEGEEKKMTF